MTTEAFAKSVVNYLSILDKPWTKLFYEAAWFQIEAYLVETGQSMLDVGCGFGVTSIHFSLQGHVLTSIEPTSQMLAIAKKKAAEQQQNITFNNISVEQLAGNVLERQFDWILCHNILEYIESPEYAFHSFGKLVKDGGHISIIAHNPAAKLLKKAVIQKQPKLALESIGNDKEYVNTIQTEITTYSFERLVGWLRENDFELIDYYGIHNIYYLVDDNDLKMNQAWNEDVVRLELELGGKSPYRDIALWTHIVARKKSR